MSCTSNTSLDVCTLTTTSIGAPALITAFCGVLTAVVLVFKIQAAEDGNKDMVRISNAVKTGAKAFLSMEYRWLACMVTLLYVLISVAVHWQTGICYLAGATTSAACGYLGMMIATTSNQKTAQAAQKGLDAALRVSFNSGSVMGLSVVSFGLGVLSILLMAFGNDAIQGHGALAGFGMGASTVAIFARVGGGIFTKAADVGADLVGKCDLGLPEDDVRNPAVVADNVGDNVGDVAGMGADLFSSFVGSTIAAALLGSTQTGLTPNTYIALPFWISMSGIFASMIGMLTVRCEEGATQSDLLRVLRRAVFLAAFFQFGFMAIIVYILGVSWKLYACIVIGLVAGAMIALISEYFTSYAFPPTQNISKSAVIGPANVVIQGLAVGMYATIAPAIIIGSVLIATLELSGPYGIALSSVGLLSTLGITLSTDAYGPVADNAGGIAEMAHMPPHVRKNTDVLDALGNTTAAIGKGFAVGSAVLTAVSLLTTFISRVGLTALDVVSSKFVIPGIMVGAMLPYFFAAMTMNSVNVAAQSVVVEVKRQWDTIKGLKEGTTDPDWEKCVMMITRGALHAMVFPVLLVICAPLVFGVGLGPEMLAGVLLGGISSGFVLGLMMSTAGGAWDNSKKYIEQGVHGGKGSQPHKAAVVGDTIGDPFKDTSGPAINIQIKLMSYISVVLAPVFKNQAGTYHADGSRDKEPYWWAAIILLAILYVFVNLWDRFTPEGMDGKSVDEFALTLAKQQGIVAPARENGDEQKSIELQAAPKAEGV